MHLVLQSILPTKLLGSQRSLAVSTSEHPKIIQEVLSGNQLKRSMDQWIGLTENLQETLVLKPIQSLNILIFPNFPITFLSL
jgi:hypothetical protein